MKEESLPSSGRSYQYSQVLFAARELRLLTSILSEPNAQVKGILLLYPRRAIRMNYRDSTGATSGDGVLIALSFRKCVALEGSTAREKGDHYEAADLAFLMTRELPGVAGARTHGSIRAHCPWGNHREVGRHLAPCVQRKPGGSINQALGRSPLRRLREEERACDHLAGFPRSCPASPERLQRI